MPNTFDTALSGLTAAQLGLATTSHNIANASTEGYTRQRVEQVTRQPQLQGNLWVGTGTEVDEITRIKNEFLDIRLQNLSSENSRLQSFHNLASRLDNMMSSDSLGLTPVMQDFFNAIENLNSDPASQAARQVVIDSAESLTARFHTQQSQMSDLEEEVNNRIKSDVADINSIATSLARLNEEIISSQGQSQGKPPNDLLDQRDQLVLDLSTYIDVSTVTQDSGQMDVYIGNGINLVIGKYANPLATVSNSFEPSKLEVAMQTSTGATTIDSLVSGGSLGGLLDFRRSGLDELRGELGRIAVAMTTSMNTQHAMGTDLYGDAGIDIFSIGEPAVLEQDSNTGNAALSLTIDDTAALSTSGYQIIFDGANYITRRMSDEQEISSGGFPISIDGMTISLDSGAMAAGDAFYVHPTMNAARDISVEITDTNRIALSAPVKGTASLANSGGAQLNQPTVLDITDAALQDEVAIVFNDATTFNIVDVGTGANLATNVAYSGGSNIDFNGWRTQISGIPDAGDTFTISATTSAVSDNRNGLAMVNLQDQKLIGGFNTIQEGISTMVGEVGSMTRQSEVAGSAQEQLLNLALQERDSVSGVNLDEEAINLTRYQQAYQASAQVLSTANSLFDSILAIFV